MLRWTTFILVIGAINARLFNNPVLSSENYHEPGAIKVDGAYYIVTRITDGGLLDKFAIHESTDYINWKLAGHIFDETNYPVWTNNKYVFWEAKIHKIGSTYNVYFAAFSNETSHISIGVAVAAHPLGPYTAIDRPLLSTLEESPWSPNIINDNGDIYLMWKSEHSKTIKARQLNPNGLTFTSDQDYELIRANLTWEENYVGGPWYVHRGNYHYIMYTGNAQCESRAIGVARSRYVLGPYEKMADPILVSNNDFISPSYNSLVKDLDEQTDVIVFQTTRAGVECIKDETVIALASVGWTEDGWPYVFDF